MFNIGPLELIIILVVALLVVGPARLPEMGRTIGKSLREFRRAQDEVRRSLEFDLDEDQEEVPEVPDAPSEAAEETERPRGSRGE
jgi:Tat protein translocase TatB subunit